MVLCLTSCGSGPLVHDGGSDGGDRCTGIMCPYGERCVEGSCVPVPDADVARDVGPPRDADRDGGGPDADHDDGSTDAEVDTGPTCGNGRLESPEECDDGDENSDVLADACREDCTRARCGDDVIDSGEQCDGEGLLCDESCHVSPPDSWSACQDSAGRWALFFVESALSVLSWSDAQDWCVTTIESLSPRGASYYGLAVIHDDALWACLEPRLETGLEAQHWVGLHQDPDQDEPPGGTTAVEAQLGWSWTAFDGTAWIDVAPFDDASPLWAGDELDNGGGSTDADCIRIFYDAGAWEGWDYACDLVPDWSAEPLAGGICGVQF